MSSFGDKVKKLRKEKGWSQDELGEKIGIHGRHISKYESGSAMPNAETVIRMADTFDVSTDFLLRDNDRNENPAAKIGDKVLLHAFEVADQMAEKEKAILKELIEAFVAKKQIQHIVGTKFAS